MKRRNNLNPASEKLANIIVQKTILLQTRWASYMQRKVEKLSVKSKKYSLFFFALLTVMYSCCIIIQSFTGHTKHAIRITNIHLPKTILEENKPPPVSEKEYRQIERYKKYMDSCGLQIRPGLADSIREIEKIYQSFKNK